MQNQLPAPTASGSLGKTPFLHLLVYALERRLTGTFELACGEGPNATILVHEGCPAKVRTSEAVCFLGTVLSELGLITLEQLEASLARMQETPRLQGEILLEMAAITPPKLTLGLETQVQQKIERLFGLPAETTFAYYDGLDLLARYGGAPTPTDPLPALWRGARARPSLEHVEATLQRIGSTGLRAHGSAQLARFAFGPDESKIVDILTERPVRVAEMTAMLGDELGRALAYFLTIMKQVELIDLTALPTAKASEAPPPPAPEPPPPTPSTRGNPPSPPTGQAFARVQLTRQATRSNPMVVEEMATPSAHDPRASTPGMPRYPTTSDAPPPSGPPLTAEQSAQKEKILLRAEQISSEDYFQMLGVPREAPVEVVQKSFISLAKVWHPDRLPPALADVKDACSKVFAHLTEANATLTDAAKRAQYATLLKDGGATPDDQAKIQAIVEAATEFQKAEFLLKRNALDPKAHELVARAVKLDDQPDYVATLAWLDAQRIKADDRPRTLEQIGILGRCIDRAPRSERAFFYRGMLYKRAGDGARALEDFKRVAELNPKNLDAMREVRVHNMRQNASRSSTPPPAVEKRPDGGGIFGKLFKK